jgi:predicted CoA-binding protein
LVNGAGQLQVLGHLRVLVAYHEVDDIENKFGTVKVEFNVDMADKVRNQAVNFKLLSVVFFQMQVVSSCQHIKKQRLECLQRI